MDFPPDRHQQFLDQLARRGHTRTWQPGERVVTEGEAADALFLVHSGELRVTVAGDGGREVELNTLQAGDFFGELMLTGERRTATVQATTRAQLTRVDRGQVEQLLRERSDLAFELVQHLAERVRKLTGIARDLASKDVYGRLAGLLEALAVAQQGRRVVPGPLTQQRIADRVGASRAMVNRLLQDLETGGYIARQDGRIELLKALPARW